MHEHSNEDNCCPSSHGKRKTDWIMLISTTILSVSILLHLLLPQIQISAPKSLHHFAGASLEILLTMWWGVVFGVLITGAMSKVPREFFTAIMGRSNSFSGLLRAVFGGVLLDLCSHGIVLIAAKLYERGISYPQVITFLVASPWNSFSLTLILIALIGLKWTLIYILGSVIIALITGVIMQVLVRNGVLPENPHAPETNENFKFWPEAKSFCKTIRFSKKGTLDILKAGLRDGRMLIKWLLFGVIIAAALRTYVPADMFADWLGPSLFGLFITLIFATIVEICSEGAAPVAGEIFTNANAPGNAFSFLMAGVATDYTEIMVVREFTKSWAMALAIPLVTVPQVVLIGWIMNQAAI